ncbi:uncharacterized protein LOC143349822 [Colletes latitarsis]|uniref:uncharacterized protein LOC143349822 n=1 Tax=Colletes latitarsis TaxID=2605962 RepID=UPI004036EB71
MSVGHLKPFEIPPDKKPLQEEDTVEEPSRLIRTMWHDQLKVFHEHGLDKAALAATETCKLCETNDNNICMEFADTVQQPYEELLDDMRTFDEKLNEKTENGGKIERKISSIL